MIGISDERPKGAKIDVIPRKERPNLSLDSAHDEKRAGLTDFLRVLLRPISTFRKNRNASDIAKLVFLIIGIDFFLSLLLLPTFVVSLGKIGAAAPSGSGAKVTAVAAAMIFSTTLNMLVMLLMTGIFSAVLVILRRKFSPGRLLAALMLASSPLIVERVIRIAASYLFPSQSALVPLLPISTFIDLSGSAASVGSYFTLFDVWTFLLVCVALASSSRLRPMAAIVTVLILWGGLQVVFFRLHSLG